MVSGESQRSPARARLLLLVLFCVEFLYLLYNPPFANPDELSHLQAVRFVQEERRLPDPYRDRPKIQQDKHPPYTYVLGALVLEAVTPWFEGSEVRYELPGPHAICLEPGRVSEHSGIPDGALYALRFVFLLHWLLFARFLLAYLDLAFPSRPRYAWALSLAGATIPQAALSGAALTPDVPLAAFSAGALVSFGRGALGAANSRRLGLAGGLWFALALLAKSAAVFLVPVLLGAAWARSLRLGRREAWRFLAWACLPPLLLAAWWYARNTVLYGDPFQMRAQIETYTHSVRRSPWTAVFFEVFFEDTFRSFFGFWEREALLARPFFYLAAGALGAACAGLCLLLRRPARAEVDPEAVRLLPLSLIGAAVLSALTLAGNLTVHSPQGRYLYPALPAFVQLAGLGWIPALRLRRDGRWPIVLAAAWVLYGLFSFDAIYLDRHFVRRAHAFGGGGVLFYEDCGSPGLHPHRVQGFDVPDGASLGRRIPWRTLDGHPDAVVYRFPIPKGRRRLQVRVTYFNPDPRLPYLAEAQARVPYPALRLRADGRLLHARIDLTPTPQTFVYPLPDELLADGLLELRFELISGDAALVAELWIEDAWLTIEHGSVRNRLDRPLRALVLVRGGKIEPRSLVVPARSRVPLGLQPGREARVLPELESPWSSIQAEAHPAPGVRWFGDLSAEGAYLVRGSGLVAELPLPADLPEGVQLFVRRKEDSMDWGWQPAPRSAGRRLRLVAGAQASFDAVRICGGWR